MTTFSALNVAAKIEAEIRVRVFLVSLYRRLLSQHPCILLCRYRRIVVVYIFELGDVCGIRTPSTVRISLSLFSSPCSFLPVSKSLDPANDSWKNNSENEKPTTVERWEPVEAERDRGKQG